MESLFARVGFSPNDNQRQAIEHLDGPLFLVAGPGSGKTRVLLWRVVNMVAFHGVPPESIFLSTFTEKAAKQLQDGLVSLLGLASEQPGKPYFATLGSDYRLMSPRVDECWRSRGAGVKQKNLGTAGEPTGVAVLVYDLKAAATAFSEGQAPERLGRVYLEPRKAKRPDLFVAKVVGNSMSRVAPDGAWCLWQHLGAAGVPAAAPGEYLLVRREDPGDPRLGDFTFKRWERTATGTRLSPVSRDKKFKPILLTPDDEETTTHLARFIEVLHLDEADVQ